MGEAEFVRLFADRLIEKAPNADPDELRLYAAQTAPAYYRNPMFSDDGPDPAACADSDMECWD